MAKKKSLPSKKKSKKVNNSSKKIIKNNKASSKKTKKRGRKKKDDLVEKKLSSSAVSIAHLETNEQDTSTVKETPDLVSRMRDFQKKFPDFGAGKNSYRDVDFESYQDLVLEVVAAWEDKKIHFDYNSMLAVKSGSKTAKIQDSAQMLDQDILRSSLDRFSDTLSERIDKNLINNNNKVYIAKWTNRVAIWWFFEHFYSKFINKGSSEIDTDLTYHLKKITDKNPNARKVTLANPFAQYEHAFETVMNAWMPAIKKVVNVFVVNTRNGRNLQEEFLSVGYLAFLHALEKQGMAILANAKASQGIPFPKRLEFALRKALNSSLPDLTGPLRVPIESAERKNMVFQEISIDFWSDDNNTF